MAELKVGDSKTFEVGGQQLLVEPIPYGRLKRLVRLVAEVSQSFDPRLMKDDFLSIVPSIVENYVDQFIPELFDLKKHPFLTKEWIEENMTIPMTKDVIIAAITVNGLGDFFVKTVKNKAAQPEAPESIDPTTRTENSPSITPSDSPMVGDPATSMS